MSKYAAVHMISESADRYNHLVKFDTPKDAVAKLSRVCYEGLENMAAIYVTCEDPKDAKEIKHLARGG